jgi:hypothetical protein
VKQGDGNRLRPGPQANPAGDTAQCEPAILRGSAVAETVRASGHERRAKQAGHMTARNDKLSPDFTLAPKGPSTYVPGTPSQAEPFFCHLAIPPTCP